VIQKSKTPRSAGLLMAGAKTFHHLTVFLLCIKLSHNHMALMSPFRYRLHRIKEAIFGDDKIIYEVLIHHKQRLPANDVRVAWEREGDFIVGRINTDGHLFVAQGRSATEFIECVNDVLYAVYQVPIKYAESLGGDYRLTPPKAEFENLNNKAIKKSTLALKALPA
jgi:hypothetical protein